MPQSPAASDSLKPLYQWLSFPWVAWPNPSIWVATLSLMNRAQLCHAVNEGLSWITPGMSFWLFTPSGDRNMMISPGLCPGHLYDVRS